MVSNVGEKLAGLPDLKSYIHQGKVQLMANKNNIHLGSVLRPIPCNVLNNHDG